MGEVSYKPIIEDMTWSYSRVNSFDGCRYAWFLKYILGIKETDKFYSSYGSLVHKLLEEYYRGDIKKEDMLKEFLYRYQDAVKGERPRGDTVEKYINGAIQYLNDFTPLPFKMIEVEKRIDFVYEGKHIIGFIDFLGQTEDGELVIVDHKSGDIKPRSKRAKPTVKDAELDQKLRQLYVYSIAIEKEYGKTPKYLCFNCFRTGNLIQEEFEPAKYEEAKQWLANSISDIENAEEFYPSLDMFSCKWICGVSHQCEFWEDYSKDWRKNK